MGIFLCENTMCYACKIDLSFNFIFYYINIDETMYYILLNNINYYSIVNKDFNYKFYY